MNALGLRPPGKGMNQVHASDPGPRGTASYATQGQDDGCLGGVGHRPIGSANWCPGGKRVFVDFGRSRVYSLLNDSDEVLVFNDLSTMAEKLKPSTIVVDDIPRTQQNTAAELAKTGITFMRLKDLKKLADERKNNGIRKSDENDVELLRTLYHRCPEAFQPVFTSPEELKVRALAEMWVELAGLKKSAKHARTTSDNPVVTEAHKTLRKLVDNVAAEIHKEALRLPLYRRVHEELRVQGPCLAYIISHDGWALITLTRDRLVIRYAMTHHHKRRPLRSQLLILLARAAVLHRHPRYSRIYEDYRQKGKTHWAAILRVAKRLLIDIRQLQRIQKAGGPPA